MQIIRTIVWVLLLLALLAFSYFNWEPVEVTIWQNLVLETKIPALVLVSFLIGLVPMWLLHRATKWQLKRKLQSLEISARTVAATPIAPAEEEPEVSEPEANYPTPASSPHI